MMELFGNDEARGVVRRMLRSERLPHALLFSGPAGVGKRTFALSCAAGLFCTQTESKDSPCHHCKECHLVSSGSYPDLHILDAAKEGGISAAETRELIDTLQLSPMGGLRRVVLIDNAEWLPSVSANILLKILEEPPANTTFFLITSNAERVLVTIRSRCHRINFGPLTPAEMRSILRENPSRWGVDSATLERASIGATSLEGISLALANRELWESVRAEVARITSGDTIRALSYAQEIAKERDSLRSTLRLLQQVVIHMFRETDAGPVKLRFSHAVTNLALAEPLIFERHLNATFVLTSVFLRLSGISPHERYAPLAHGDSILSRIVV